MRFKLVKLNFTAPLHIGIGKPDFYGKSDTVLHSDTLKSAIFSTALLFYKETTVEELFNSFTVSSAFPFFKDKLFFPVPSLPPNELIKRFEITFDCDKDSTGLDYDKGKIIKKIKYLDKELYLKFISGEKIPVKIMEQNVDKQQLISGYLMSDFMEVKKFKISHNEVQQRVYVSRMSEVLASDEENIKFTDPYYVDKIFFHEDAGLFFLIEPKEKFNEDDIKKSLELLKDFGLGTDRNVGNGQFDYSIEDISIDTTDNTLLATNLSLFIPSEEEMKNLKSTNNVEDRIYYSILERGGYISNYSDKGFGTLLKNPISMFAENSVFPNINLKGKVEDVTPKMMENKHKVWRDGTSIFIPLK